jgi:hypothetical protein
MPNFNLFSLARISPFALDIAVSGRWWSYRA